MEASNDTVNLILHWINTHPQLAGLVVFLIAMTESLVIVGILIPGVAMMFGVGALIGSGVLEFFPIMAWAVTGAIAGDSFSFWIGKKLSHRALHTWPFSTHPQLTEKGFQFFKQYGGFPKKRGGEEALLDGRCGGKCQRLPH